MGAFNVITNVNLDDVGYAIPVDMGQDISAFDMYELLLRTPADDATTKVVSCQIDPDDVCSMVLIVSAGTFDVIGTWLAQPRLTQGSEVIYGQQFEIEVEQNLIES